MTVIATYTQHPIVITSGNQRRIGGEYNDADRAAVTWGLPPTVQEWKGRTISSGSLQIHVVSI